MQLKTQLSKYFVWPILMYGCDTWTLSKGKT